MNIFAYKLKFLTPVHFGAAELGGKLEAINFCYSSDTLFSALCCELAGSEFFSKFVDAVAQGKILLSDLLPYTKEKFYLPKPILLVENAKKVQRVSLDEVRKQSTQRKKQKKMEYLRAANLKKYLASLRGGESFFESANFGVEGLTQKVSCRAEEPLPYYVSEFSFNENSGLYLIAMFDDKNFSDTFAEILKLLGLSGIGGKRSSGLGKFNLAEKINLNVSCANEDLNAVQKMLTAENSIWQMTISSILPMAEDIPILKNSYYRLKKRGGFVTGGNFDKKKNSVYLIGAGSCLPKRIEGRAVILDKIDGVEIFRFGKGIFLGLDYE